MEYAISLGYTSDFVGAGGTQTVIDSIREYIAGETELNDGEQLFDFTSFQKSKTEEITFEEYINYPNALMYIEDGGQFNKSGWLYDIEQEPQYLDLLKFVLTNAKGFNKYVLVGTSYKKRVVANKNGNNFAFINPLVYISGVTITKWAWVLPDASFSLITQASIDTENFEVIDWQGNKVFMQKSGTDLVTGDVQNLDGYGIALQIVQ